MNGQESLDCDESTASSDPAAGSQADSAHPLPPGKSFSPLPEPYQAPRLQIIHFLAWMVVAAGLLKLQMVQRSHADSALNKVCVGAGQLVLSAGVVGLWAMFRSRVPRMLDRLQPGHWLLLIQTLIGLLQAGVRALLYYALQTSVSAQVVRLAYLVHDGNVLTWVYCITQSCAFLYAGRRLRGQPSWAALMYLLAVSTPFESVGFLAVIPAFNVGGMLVRLGALAMFLCPVACVLPCLVDLRRGQQRDWLHWLGWSMQESTYFVPLVYSTFYWLYYR